MPGLRGEPPLDRGPVGSPQQAPSVGDLQQAVTVADLQQAILLEFQDMDLPTLSVVALR